MRVAEQLRLAVSAHDFAFDQTEEAVTVSLGIA